MESTNSKVAPTYINVYDLPKQLHYNMFVIDGFASKLIALGGSQLAIGLIFMMIHTVVPTSEYLGEAIKSGSLYFVAGVLGIVAGKLRTRCTVVTFNILSLIAACYAGVVLGNGVISEQNDVQSTEYELNEESVMRFLGFAEVIVAIASSAVCCLTGACSCECNDCCCCPLSADSDQDEDVDFTSGDNDLGQYAVVIPVRNPGQGLDQMQNMAFSNQHPMFQNFAPLLHGESGILAQNSQSPPEYGGDLRHSHIGKDERKESQTQAKFFLVVNHQATSRA